MMTRGEKSRKNPLPPRTSLLPAKLSRRSGIEREVALPAADCVSTMPPKRRRGRMSDAREASAATAVRRGDTGEVFAAFLRLGLTSCGGPVAHLGYFHEECGVRRKWRD